VGDINPDVLRYANALRDVLVILKQSAKEESADKRTALIATAEKIATNAGLGPVVQRVKADDDIILETAVEIIAEGGDMLGWSTNVHVTDDGFCDGVVIGNRDYVDKLLDAYVMLEGNQEIDEDPSDSDDSEGADDDAEGVEDIEDDLGGVGSDFPLGGSPEIDIITESSDNVLDDGDEEEDEDDDGDDGVAPDGEMLN